jgi:uncharacterized membrane protein YdcZ (DUF606 family)
MTLVEVGASPYFWADLLRVLNMALTAFALGAQTFYMVFFVFRHKARVLRRGELLVTTTAAASFTFLLLAGVVIDIIRLHQELSPYTPVHITGALLALITIVLAVRNQRARLE